MWRWPSRHNTAGPTDQSASDSTAKGPRLAHAVQNPKTFVAALDEAEDVLKDNDKRRTAALANALSGPASNIYIKQGARLSAPLRMRLLTVLVALDHPNTLDALRMALNLLRGDDAARVGEARLVLMAYTAGQLSFAADAIFDEFRALRAHTKVGLLAYKQVNRWSRSYGSFWIPPKGMSVQLH